MQFLKYMLATIVGLFVFMVLSFIILLIIIGSAASEDKVVISENTVMKIKFDKPIVERASDDSFSNFGGPFGRGASIGVTNLKDALADAKTDSKIKGIYLEMGFMDGGFASLQEIRDALLDFKKSGKFIVAYGEYMSEGGYYIASVADKIYLNPIGSLEFNGLSAELMFFKGTLEKLGVKPQIFKVGDFKSAIEPLIKDKMSPENRLQLNSFMNSIYNNYLENVGKSRNIEFSVLKNMSDEMLVQDADDALKYNLITNVGYYDEVEAEIRRQAELKADAKIKFITPKKYAKNSDSEEGSSKNKIAIIIAEGEIVSGKGSNDNIGSDRIAGEIRKARLDKTIKAIVLRINSPGGSALASDVMWREITLAKKAKPIIASMSDYAASGGYYMAMGCSKIVAQPNTITGSIGIFGVLFNAESMLKDKLGVTTDRVTTGKYSNILTIARPLNAQEFNMFQKSVEKGYEIFTGKAAEGRKLSVDSIKKIASGRVWSGIEAKNNGLVDQLGGLNEAIKLAAKTAKLGSDYKIRYYPAQKNFIAELMEGFNDDMAETAMKAQFGEMYPYVKEIKNLKNLEGVQARLPYSIQIR